MKLWLIVVSVVACQIASASDVLRPQYELSLKPEKSKSIVLPSLGVVTTKTSSAAASESGRRSGTRMGVEYLYGNTDDWSYGGRVSYLDLGSSTSNSKGLNDLEFVAKSKKEYKNETLLYGATFYWSPGKARYNGASSNNFSGGYALEPYGSLVKKFKNSRMSFNLAYSKRFDRKFVETSNSPSVVGNIEGGDVATAGVSYDYFYKDNILGASGTSYRISDEVFQSGSFTESAAMSVFKGEVYWMGQVSPGTKFIPSFQYLEINDSETGSFRGTQVNLAYMKSY